MALTPVPTTSTPPAPASGGVSVAVTATRWTYRVLATLQAAMLVLQPVSMGSFLSGSYAALDVHGLVGASLVPTTALTAGVAGLLALLTRRPWPAAGAIALTVLVTAQVALGYSRGLAWHVPLGVLVVALGLWLAVASWTHRPQRHRHPHRPPSRGPRWS